MKLKEAVSILLENVRLTPKDTQDVISKEKRDKIDEARRTARKYVNNIPKKQQL